MDRTLTPGFGSPDVIGMRASGIPHVLAAIFDPVTNAVEATFFSSGKRTGSILLLGLALAAPMHAACAFLAVHAARFASEKTGALEAGITMQGLLVNALFLGLAVATCSSGPWQAFLLTLTAAPLTVCAALVCRRLLLPWNLPVYVAPYLLVVWGLWYAGSYSEILKLALPVEAAPEALTWISVLTSLSYGFSQIFFIRNEWLGLLIAATLVFAFRRTGILMVAAGIYAVAAGFVLKCEPWIAHSGLLAFPAVLSVAALRVERQGSSGRALMTAVILAPLFELAALRAGFFLGLPAFSGSYLALMWVVQLYRESIVRFGAVPWRSHSIVK